MTQASYTNNYQTGSTARLRGAPDAACRTCGGAKAIGGYAHADCADCRLRAAGRDIRAFVAAAPDRPRCTRCGMPSDEAWLTRIGEDARVCFMCLGPVAQAASDFLAGRTGEAGWRAALAGGHDPATCDALPCPACEAGPEWGHPDGSVDFLDVDLDDDRWVLDRGAA